MDKVRLDLVSSEVFLRLKQASEIASLLDANNVEIANKQFVAEVVNVLIDSARTEYELNLEREELGDED